MLEEKYFEIINRYIEKSASEDEIKELYDFIEANPDKACPLKNMIEFSNLKKEDILIDPPNDLKLKIMNEVEHIKINTDISPKASYDTSIQTLPVSKKNSSIFTFLVGAAAGICLFVIGTKFFNSSNFNDNSNMSGTILYENKTEKITQISQVDFSEDSFSGSIIFEDISSNSAIELRFESDTKTNITINYGSNDFDLKGFSSDLENNEIINLKEGEISISGELTNRFYILFERKNQHSLPIQYFINTDITSKSGQLKTVK